MKINKLDNDLNVTIEGGKREALEKERKNLVNLLNNAKGDDKRQRKI